LTDRPVPSVIVPSHSYRHVHENLNRRRIRSKELTCDNKPGVLVLSGSMALRVLVGVTLSLGELRFAV